MEKTTVTKREMYSAIRTAVETQAVDFGDTVTVQMVMDFCDKEIATLDARAGKAKERAAQKKAQGDEMTEAVYAALSTDEFEPITTIVPKVDAEDVTVGKVVYRLTKLVEAGAVEKSQITLPATEETKSRKVQGYKAKG